MQTPNPTVEKYLENIKLSNNQLNMVWTQFDSISSETGGKNKYLNENNLITYWN
jgi:hypothetical protein